MTQLPVITVKQNAIELVSKYDVKLLCTPALMLPTEQVVPLHVKPL